jgi:hypothetical protein
MGLSWGMLLRRLILLAVSSVPLCLAACGGTSTTGSGGDGGGGSTTTGIEPREPAVHRAAAMECTAERPPGSVDPALGGDCMADAECTDGSNGRCVQALGEPAFCSYDACAVDADCGGGSVCECRNPSMYDANVCVHGNCLVDSDCGEGGYCSPSAVTLDPFCTEGVPIGSVGYFCHSAGDECIDDADCKGEQEACFFDVDKLHFACFQLICVL